MLEERHFKDNMGKIKEMRVIMEVKLSMMLERLQLTMQLHLTIQIVLIGEQAMAILKMNLKASYLDQAVCMSRQEA